MHQRICPKCNKVLNYTTKKNRNFAERKKKRCISCVRKEVHQRPEYREKMKLINELYKERYKGEGNPFYGRTHTKQSIEKIQKNRDTSFYNTPEYKAKMSLVTSGSNNPMYGKNIYKIWLSKYGKEEADKRLADLAGKRSVNATGERNPMFGKPPPRGAGSGWGGWYKGWYFRSLKELSYMIYVIEKNGYKWESAEKKKFSVPYIDHLGNKRTYRADFLLDNKILIEVKPKQLMDTVVNQTKKVAAEHFCIQHGYEYRMVDVKTLGYSVLNKLCQNGQVILSGERNKRKLEKHNAS